MPVRVLLIAVSVALLGFAPAPLPKKERTRDDLTDVTGTWEFILWEYSGVRSEVSERSYQIAMTKEKCDIETKDGKVKSNEFVMSLDPKASPPSFTWSRGGAVAFVGSYRLRKGEITMIFAHSSRLEDRPTDFAGKPAYRFVLRRSGL